MKDLKTPGKLTLQAELGIPVDSAAVTFASDNEFVASAGPFSANAARQPEGEYRSVVNATPMAAPQTIGVTLATRQGAALPKLEVVHTTSASSTPRPVTLEALSLPGFARERQPVNTTPPPPALTQGGDWAAGKALFFGDAKCGTCHTVGGEGGHVGPNLSNLMHLNPESVLQDIVEPSARINPDHINYIVTTTDGDTVAGLVRQEGDQVLVTEGPDKVTTVERSHVKEVRPSKISLMPEGYKALGEEKLRDLLTYLTTEPPKGKK